LRSTPPV